jgi:hypothetical protein
MARTGQTLVTELRADLDEAYPANWTDPNLLMWLNKGIVELVRACREQRQHWFDKVLLSTDSAQTIAGETYDPTVSLAPTTDGTTLTLPLDCVEVVSITPTDQDDLDNGLQFVLSKPSASEFVYASRLASNSDQGTYLYYLRGQRTVHVAPAFGTTFDIKVQYVGMPDEITYSQSPTGVADWLLDLAVMYAHYRALYSIKHQDYITALAMFEKKEKTMMSLARRRESSDPVLTESVFDGYDSYTDW